MKILVTGGAGFIGSHLVDRLINKNHEVTILDNLSSTNGKIPSYLNPAANFINVDIRSAGVLNRFIPEVDAIFHEAASVGIAQSNYTLPMFIENNCGATGQLLQTIIETKSKPKLILSCSNTTYGEGLYHCNDHKNFHPSIRSSEQVKREGFDIRCPSCNMVAMPVPTNESTPLDCNSIYALTKKFQEESALMIGKMYDFPVVLLKYFNVFGPRQSLSNPYSGVSAIFMNRVKMGKMPIIYEDGNQSRDFISIDDVVEANMLALENSDADYQTFNVGSGIPISIKTLAEQICWTHKTGAKYEITGQYRKGDIRHCIADISRIKKVLGWSPKVALNSTLSAIYEWSKNEETEDNFDRANGELKKYGLN